MDTPTDTQPDTKPDTQPLQSLQLPINQAASISTVKKTVEKILSSDTPLEYIEKAGIDLLSVYRNLGRIALNAKIMAKDRDGDVFELGEDNRSQIMATTLLLELAKHIKDKNVVIAQGIFNSKEIEQETDRVLALRKKYEANK